MTQNQNSAVEELVKDAQKNPEFVSNRETQPQTQTMESPFKRKSKIYVAGKYSTLLGGMNPAIEILTNMKIGIEWSVILLCSDMIPFCPWLDYQFFLTPDGGLITERQIRDYSMEWLRVCDAVFIVNEDWERSFGVREEIKEAKKIGLPVFKLNQFASLIKWRDEFNG